LFEKISGFFDQFGVVSQIISTWGLFQNSTVIFKPRLISLQPVFCALLYLLKRFGYRRWCREGMAAPTNLWLNKIDFSPQPSNFPPLRNAGSLQLTAGPIVPDTAQEARVILSDEKTLRKREIAELFGRLAVVGTSEVSRGPQDITGAISTIKGLGKLPHAVHPILSVSFRTNALNTGADVMEPDRISLLGRYIK